MKNTLDKEIVDRILQNDKSAFIDLINRYKNKGFSLSMKILKNKEDAEEALQDSFIRVFNALNNFNWNSSFSTWFYRIVFNVCYSRTQAGSEKFYKLGSSISDMEEGGVDSIGSNKMTPDTILINSEIEKIVNEEIEKLPPHYSIVLDLFLLQEQSYEEIVSITGINMGTVKAQISRARIILRNNVANRLELNSLANIY
ncbi:MAG: sigma-70 family RNA polymerase sigma factor [Chlorobiota bacterium]|nr:sigma-70 family RNA polymerase sigma factor [Chlorobiota bacterium]QQS66056.1 MAG: sigma-70 family RNA polymerase sigma factor [Chlorobiota bacterium]